MTAGRLGEAFVRSLAHWQIDYRRLDTTRAAVACIDWNRIDNAFLADGRFAALGYSFGVAREAMAVKIATEGCRKMAARQGIESCVCETVLVDDEVRITVPNDVVARLR